MVVKVQRIYDKLHRPPLPGMMKGAGRHFRCSRGIERRRALYSRPDGRSSMALVPPPSPKAVPRGCFSVSICLRNSRSRAIAGSRSGVGASSSAPRA
jgi:hypothetical protein